MKLIALAAVGLLLSGCATGAKLTPEQAQTMLDHFHSAGCGGQVDLQAGASTGQLGGQASVSLGIHGQCPTADHPPANHQ